MTSTSCPTGYSLVGTSCLRDCATGFTTDGDSCFANCPSGNDLQSSCEKVVTTRTLIAPAQCPPNTTYSQSQTNQHWPAPNNARLLEFCFDACPKPDLQKYAADDSGTCIPKACGYDDNTGIQYPEVLNPGEIIPSCSRAAYRSLRTFNFGSCPANKYITFKDSGGTVHTDYTSPTQIISNYGYNFNTVDPSAFGINWVNMFDCNVPCPKTADNVQTVRYDQLDLNTYPWPSNFPNYYKSQFYCFVPDLTSLPIFVDPQTDIPNDCSSLSGGGLFGTTTVVPDAADNTGFGYFQENVPVPVKITDSIGVYSPLVTYNVGDIVATFTETDPASPNYSRFKGPFFKILDPTKQSLGLPAYTASNLYYADPFLNLNNAFATTKEIGTSIDYNYIRYAGEDNFYKSLCLLDSTVGNAIYCPPLCSTLCPKGNPSTNFGLQEPFFETNTVLIWTNGASYAVNDIVSYFNGSSSSYYTCVTANTASSGNAPPNATYWSGFSQWNNNTNYTKNQVVYVQLDYGQQLYICLQSHHSTSLIYPPSSPSYWDELSQIPTNAVCYPRCGSSVLYEGNGKLCIPQSYQSSSVQPQLAYSYCPNNSMPLPQNPGYQNTNSCYSLCPINSTLLLPDQFPNPSNPTDPNWLNSFLNCITECPLNENFYDNGDKCVKIAYKRQSSSGSPISSIQSSVSNNLQNNAATVSKISLYGGTTTLFLVVVGVFIVSSFLVFVLWSRRLYYEKIK